MKCVSPVFIHPSGSEVSPGVALSASERPACSRWLWLLSYVANLDITGLYCDRVACGMFHEETLSLPEFQCAI